MDHLENIGASRNHNMNGQTGTVPGSGVVIPKVEQNNQGRPDVKVILDFLKNLYGSGLDSGFLVIWTKGDRQSRFFPVAELENAAMTVAHLGRLEDVFFGIGLQGKEPEGNSRGTAGGVAAIPGFWLDLDIKSPNHASDKYPPDQDSALEFLRLFNLKPTMIVSTGGGLHVYWLFKEPLVIGDHDRESVKAISERFQGMFIEKAQDSGWEIDKTFDLARVLRLPGTFNRKGVPQLVEVIESNLECRYRLDQIEKAINQVASFNAGESDILRGQRNNTLTSIAGKLRAEGFDYEKILEELSELNRDRCKPPLKMEEVETISRSVSKYAEGKGCGGNGPKQSNSLVEIAGKMKLFHTPEKECYARIPVDSHWEIWPLRSKEIRHYLAKLYYENHKSVPGAQAMQEAIDLLKGKALFDSGECIPVHTRLAESEGSIYLDLGNDGWEMVKITPDGWEVQSDSPVAFCRPSGMKPLPRPEKGGDIRELFSLINAGEEEMRLIVAWLVGAYRPTGPFPILILHGEQGSAKSTTARILKELVDPSAAPLRSLSKNDRDLMIAARNSRVLAFDNLSGIAQPVSDALCRLATGGGFSTRSLYSDAGEMIFEAKRPIILNGIDDLTNRSDLADRALVVNLPRIPETKRVLESDLWTRFERMKPMIMGALFDAVCMAKRNFGKVKLSSLPRMADFAQWVAAAEPALPWESGKFMETYQKNRQESSEACLDSDVVSIALMGLLSQNRIWEGTASDLLSDLEQFNNTAVHGKKWPRQGNQLSSRLTRLAPALRSKGVEVIQTKRNGKKLWKFSLGDEPEEQDEQLLWEKDEGVDDMD